MFMNAWHKRGVSAVLVGAVLAGAGCGGGSTPTADPPTDPVTDPRSPTGVVVFTAAAAPAKLSAWRLLLSDGQRLSLAEGVVPYSLNTPLFSDYAHKFRTIWLPEGTQMDYTASGPLQFPVGAIVTKSFFYPRAMAGAIGAIGALKTEQSEGGEAVDLAAHRLLETRLMVREPTGRWGAVTYVWDVDQRDATLVRAGRNIAIELVDAQGTSTPFTYAVPTDAQCVTCHATNVSTGTFQPIGPQAHNMNRRYTYAVGDLNQLDHLASLKMLAGYTGSAPAMPVWTDATASISDRARAYLDVNCASCHNSNGRSGSTGLWLNLGVTDPLRLGICKPPVGGQQNARFSYDVAPGNADASFLYFRLSNYRLNSDPPRVAMPELGRHVFDAEGNALVRAWINAMSPGCP
ncbi:MAG TPA: SO2930 family diheme c-type cytochrome [Hydrogenophaga sp.]|uniref:SO2930 family diheme c-type cytochrome n=1 Tax=Hydrogenophaga sp. TaxID=1904254 RepID=UPI002BAC85C5|nr:SO2930 family diheme c-type cytochrome [Hydrogenophaga sp.]HMN93918.1 SO2930 family diheme c-type cytochrome [Hydrogenophaga sp.]HMP11965.1 SO2930 family diheme c-type cytochrome [Hydrogenophaga sp.]